ncbi:MAG: GTP cyclohydrolase II [Deltaproteobacteria bacterium]|nr:GTP cyclohydrolase II [Deltaproteobacteria bacterium]
MVLVRDDRAPQRGGVLVSAAERTSDDVVNFMAAHGRGLVSLALMPDRLERLGLAPVSPDRGLARERYTASIEAKRGVSTGISALDRARTIHVAANPQSRPEDIVTPGHVFPAAAEPDGLIVRAGWAEAAVDLARLAGMQPAGAFCAVLDDAGEVTTGAALADFARTHGLVTVTIGELIDHRMASESFVTQQNQALLPTAHGDFIVRVFENGLTGRQHLALSCGEIRTGEPVLVRLHSECLTGDVFGSRRCDCGAQLDRALAAIHAEGRGVVLYLRQEGRGIGLANKVRAYSLQDAGRDTVEANVELGLPIDQRDYGVAAQMLHALGVARVRLMTNNPEKIDGLVAAGVEVVSREPLEVAPGAANRAYLETKKHKLGHLLDEV